MSEKEMLTKKFIMVDMGDAMISTDDKYIIGTQALATCTGILIYSESSKKAIVAHISSDYIKTLDKIFKLIIEYKLYGDKLKYAVIPGADREAHDYYGVFDALNKHFVDYDVMNEENVSNGVILDADTFSKQFAFDALNGIFVSDKVLFGTDYYSINPDFNDINEYKKR